jgi:hypothetical protein
MFIVRSNFKNIKPSENGENKKVWSVTQTKQDIHLFRWTKKPNFIPEGGRYTIIGNMLIFDIQGFPLSTFAQ